MYFVERWIQFTNNKTYGKELEEINNWIWITEETSKNIDRYIPPTDRVSINTKRCSKIFQDRKTMSGTKQS